MSANESKSKGIFEVKNEKNGVLKKRELTASRFDLLLYVLTLAIARLEPQQGQMRNVTCQLEIFVKTGEIDNFQARTRPRNEYAKQHIVQYGRPT